MLVAVHPDVKEQLIRTGHLDRLGEENVFVRTADVGESIVLAYNQANQWIAEVSQADPDAGPTVTRQGLADAGQEVNGDKEGDGKAEND